MKQQLLFIGITSLVLGMTACSFFGREKDRSQELVKKLDDSTVILEYNGGKITAGDVNQKVTPQFERLREQLLNAYVQAANDELIERMKDKLKTTDFDVSEAEISQYMTSNRVAPDQKENIRKFLISEKSRIQKQLGSMQLMAELGVINRLGAARYDVKATSDMPAVGNGNVVIQVFCDFGNPICNRSRLIMKDVTSQFGDKVKWIYRHFPVASNKIGFEAAKLSICAQEQGKFWQVHDKFYDSQAALTADNMAALAVEAGANESSLKACFNSDAAQARLNEEIKAAETLGLSQTPAYFINGNKVNNIDEIKPTIQTMLSK